MRWRGALVALAAMGCAHARAPGAPVDARAAAFDAFWATYDREYPSFAYKGVDWDGPRATLRARAAAATSDSALAMVLLEAMAPLRDVHAWVRRPDGARLDSYHPPARANWDRDAWRGSARALAWRQGSTAWGWGRAGDVGYLAIGAWDDARLRLDAVDAALDSLRDTRTLVIDLRANAGGSDALALALAGRFAARPTTFGAVQVRRRLGRHALTGWHARTLAPRGPWRYAGRVIVLAGRGCFSATETFVAAMRVLPGVTVAGDTTGGSTGGPREQALVVGGRDTGWRYAVPRWLERTSDGAIIEWRGIPPHVVVPFDAALVRAGRDPVLEWALSSGERAEAR